MAPGGTITVKEEGVALVTIALVAPKNTMLLAGVTSSKFAPLITTEVPIGPEAGLNEDTKGA